MPDLKQESYHSPRWTWEILDCAMPMTFDTYSNCAHQCVYCFAYFQRAVGSSKDDYLSHKVASVDVDRVKRMFLEPDKYAKTFAWYIKGKYVLQWGGLSDGFDWYERKFRKSLELLRFFREIDYPISISTKGVWFVDDPEYQEVLRGAKNVHMKCSIITADDKVASVIEAGTPSATERFRALRKLADLGVGATTIRFRPYMLGISDKTAEEVVKKAAEAGCFSLTTEFLCLESRASQHAKARYDRISKMCGFDVFGFYRRHSAINTGLLRLNYDIKRPHIEKLGELCKEHGLKFFVSDAHHKEASEGTGCCGLPEDGPLSNINRGQYSEAMQIAKRNGRVYWSEIAAFAEGLKNIPYFQAEGFNVGTTRNKAVRRYQSMFDFMRDVWNHPDLGMSPARYFGGVLVPSGTDANGDIVYLYNDPQVQGTKERPKTSAGLRHWLTNVKDRLRQDGGKYGHVAFPIFLKTEDPQLVAQFDKLRLQPVICSGTGGDAEDQFEHLNVYPSDKDEEIIAHAIESGYEWFWILDGKEFDPGKDGPRAVLSLREGKMEPFTEKGMRLVCVSDIAGSAEKSGCH